MIDPVDVHIGARVKLRRKLMGLSQTQLGAAIGLTFQQVQKYERGTNRIAASTLHHLARALDVPVSFFFDAMEEEMRLPPAAPENVLMRRESLDLMRHYYRIPDELRRQVYELVRAMGRECEE
ncbi:MAG: helix-turn-helix transcriptional regulator [Phaeospirillum sp.]|nr:helix-turn-helix transcriptional regulator [Phaeospirillum sp.]